MNWKNVMNNLLDVLTIEEVAERTGTGAVILEQLQDGKKPEPRWGLGMALLDLHLDLCEQHHNPDDLGLEVVH
jgi:hypothetical protein